MNVFVIAGFLGSGKTTLLMSIAKAVSESGKSLAIIENEVGKVGVDDVFLKGEGLPVKEIYSGCVCCSLRLDLINTMLELERSYNPDIVIIEPSGVASPKQVLKTFEGYGGEIDRKQIVTVIDAERFNRLTDLSLPIIQDGIHYADLLIINKSDLVDDQTLNEIEARLLTERENAELIRVSATTGENIPALLELLMSEQFLMKESVNVEMDDSQKEGPIPVALSKKWPIHDHMQVKEDDFKSSLVSQLKAIALKLNEAGCSIIGHIKAVIKTNAGGYVLISTTSVDQEPHLKGRLPNEIHHAELTINVIVYGIEKSVVEKIVDSEIQI